MIEQRLIHGGHARHLGGARTLDRGDHLTRLEPRQQHHLPPGRNRPIEHAAVGEDVKERQRAQHAIRIPLPPRGAVRVRRIDLARVRCERLVGQHRRLGLIRGAARILEQGDVAFRIHVDPGHRAVVGDEPIKGHDAITNRQDGAFAAMDEAIKQSSPQRQEARHRSDHKALERARTEKLHRPRQQRHSIDSEDQADARIVHLLADFLLRAERREIDHDGAQPKRAIIGDHIIGHIGQVETDTITGPDTEPGQPGRHPARQVGDFAIAELAPEEIDERCVRPLSHHALEHVGQRERLQVERPVRRMAVGADL